MNQGLVALGALAFVSIVWAGGYVAASVAIAPDGGFGPLWLPALRLALAGGVLWGFAWWRGLTFPPRAAWTSVAGAGCLAWMGGSGLATIGQLTVPAGTTTVILGAAPLLALLLEAAWHRRAPRASELAWMGLGLAGLALAVGPAVSAALGGVLFVLAAALAWAGSGVLEAGRPAEHGHPLAIAGVQMLAAGMGMAVVAVAWGERLPQPSVAGWLAFGWLTVVCAVIGFPLWLYVLRVLPVSVSMSQATLTPVAGVALDAALLGQPVGPFAVAGSAVVLGAAYATTRSVTLPPPPTARPGPPAAVPSA